MDSGDLDSRVRLAAFEYLREQIGLHGDLLPYKVLSSGFLFNGKRVPLIGPQGIFKPAVLPEMPLTITTSPDGPYEDRLTEKGLQYRYRAAGGPNHRDNVGLRLAMTRRAPLIYLHGMVPGKYAARWPVYIVADDPGARAVEAAPTQPR